MSRKCLVIYSSYTGNTEKIALRFKDTFEREGWQCDIFKIGKKAGDILNPPFRMNDYDFVCAGSGLRVHLPYNEILNVLRRFRLGIDPRIALRSRDETIPYITEPVPPAPPVEEMVAHHRKIVLGPDSKKSIVFATYAGYEFGPKERPNEKDLMKAEMFIEERLEQIVDRS